MIMCISCFGRNREGYISIFYCTDGYTAELDGLYVRVSVQVPVVKEREIEVLAGRRGRLVCLRS